MAIGKRKIEHQVLEGVGNELAVVAAAAMRDSH